MDLITRIEQLRGYVQHKPDCKIRLCRSCGHAEWFHDLTEDLDEETCLYQGLTFTPGGECTCGLDKHVVDLLRAAEGERTPKGANRMTPRSRLREVFTNEVIRAIGALARQQNVCREQAGQAVFVTGMEAAREYIIEQLAELEAALAAVPQPELAQLKAGTPGADPTPITPTSKFHCAYCHEPLPTPVENEEALLEYMRALNAELDCRGKLALLLGRGIGISWDQIYDTVRELRAITPASDEGGGRE